MTAPHTRWTGLLITLLFVTVTTLLGGAGRSHSAPLDAPPDAPRDAPPPDPWVIEPAIEREANLTAPQPAGFQTDSTGVLHAVFHGQHLYHIAYRDAQWHTESIEDAFVDARLYPTLAIGADNSLHVAYYWPATDELRYAVNHGDEWMVEAISDTETALQPLIALSAQGDPLVVYDETTIRVAARVGGEWGIRPIPFAGTPLSMHQGNSDLLELLFLGEGGNVYFATETAGGWSLDLVAPDSAAAAASFDHDGQPVVLVGQVISRTHLQIQLHKHAADAWSMQIVDDIVEEESEFVSKQLSFNHVNLRLDANALAHISADYSLQTAGPDPWDRSTATQQNQYQPVDAATWTRRTILSGAGGMTLDAMDEAHFLVVATDLYHVHDDTTRLLKGGTLSRGPVVLTVTGDGVRHLAITSIPSHYWVDSGAGWGGRSLPLSYDRSHLAALEPDRSGNVHMVVLHEQNFPIGPDNVYAAYVPASGHAATLCSGYECFGGKYAMAVDAAARMHVVGPTVYALFDGDETVVLEWLPFTSADVTAAVDSQFNVHVAYTDESGGLYYATRDASGWSAPERVSLDAYRPDLVAQHDTIYLCYEDATDEDLVITVRADGEWTPTHTSRFSQFCSLAATGRTVHAAYATYGSFLHHASNDGSGWERQTLYDVSLSDAPLQLTWLSIALDQYGVPQIAFRLEATQDILIARYAVNFTEHLYLPLIHEQ